MREGGKGVVIEAEGQRVWGGGGGGEEGRAFIAVAHNMPTNALNNQHDDMFFTQRGVCKNHVSRADIHDTVRFAPGCVT